MVSQARTVTSPLETLPLESGDRLTREEFERRYTAMPHLKKAELIEGVVYVAAALRYRQHGRPHSLMMSWLTSYEASTPGVEVADNTTVRLDVANEPQPDALLRIDEARGGQSRISQDDYVEGAPELIVEIAASSASYDLYDKKQAYCRNGVKEYIVWQVSDRQIRWFCWMDNVYQVLEPDSAGVIYSQFFPGLNLNVTALLAEDLAQVLLTLQQGISTDAHRAFVRSLE
jgi:Uma2 family endonuclease